MSKNTLAIQESTSELKITRKKFEKTTKELQNTNDLLLDVASRPREARDIPVDVSDDIKERFELIRTRNSKGKIISYFMSGVQNRSSKNLLLRKNNADKDNIIISFDCSPNSIVFKGVIRTYFRSKKGKNKVIITGSDIELINDYLEKELCRKITSLNELGNRIS